MNKYLKIFLKILGGFILIILLFVGCFWGSMEWNRIQKKREVEQKNKSCDTILYVTEQPSLKLINFHVKDIKNLHFQILRNGKSFSDTTISNQFEFVSDDKMIREVKIPYEKFLKSDTIVLNIKPHLKYFISDFKYQAHELYGMMGPVAISDCEFSEYFSINGVENTNVCEVSKGLRE